MALMRHTPAAPAAPTAGAPTPVVQTPAPAAPAAPAAQVPAPGPVVQAPPSAPGPAPAPVVQAPPPAPAPHPPASQALAPATPAGVPAVGGQQSGVMQALESTGFAGLELGFLSFPTISLKTEGVFEDSDGRSYGKEFYCRMQNSREKWVVRALVEGKVKNNKEDVIYTYDGVNATNPGVLVRDKVSQWSAEGKQVESKKYLEVVCELVAPGTELDGQMRMLSISPTSVERLSGYLVMLALRSGGLPQTAITRVYVGEKVTKTTQDFYPWAFQLHALGTQAA